MRKIYSLIIAAVFTFIATIPVSAVEIVDNGDYTYTVTDDGFTDVNPNDWYYEAVSKAAEAGIIAGYGDGTFGPNDNVTTQQVMLICLRAIYAAYHPNVDPDQSVYEIYSDVFSGEGINNLTMAFKICSEAKYVPSGWVHEDLTARWAGGAFQAGRFPNIADALREDAAYILYTTTTQSKLLSYYLDGYYQMSGRYLEEVDKEIPDIDEVHPFYVEAVQNAYRRGIVHGIDEAGTFAPKKTLTRAEFCQMLLGIHIPETIHYRREGK